MIYARITIGSRLVDFDDRSASTKSSGRCSSSRFCAVSRSATWPRVRLNWIKYRVKSASWMSHSTWKHDRLFLRDNRGATLFKNYASDCARSCVFGSRGKITCQRDQRRCLVPLVEFSMINATLRIFQWGKLFFTWFEKLIFWNYVSWDYACNEEILDWGIKYFFEEIQFT